MSDGTKAVFLSYASQDAEAARRVCEALRAAGVEVWFDQSELRGGDQWDAKIKRQIRDCALFVPVISANTQARLEGYFRLEWKLAEDRSHLMAKGKAFIVPVVVDGTRERDAHVPDAFVAVQWTRLPLRPAQGGPDGEDAAAFAERVKSLLGCGTGVSPVVGKHGQDARATIEPAQVGRALPARRPGVVVAVAVAALALVAGWWIWRAATPAAPIAEPTARRSAPPTSEKAPTISDKSLVVLPLENLSPDPENAFFTDGMHAEIIATLQRIPDLKVISRDSAVAFKGSTAPLAEKAQKVGVAHAISGNVRRAGTSVRVQLELRRARDEALLWAQDYNKELGEGVIAIQSDIADQVARVLQARERKGSYAGAQFMTRNSEAYDLFLKASQVHYTERGAASRQKVIAGLEQALALDPAFSSAARLLATSLIFSRERNPTAQLRYAVEAKRWAETARRLLPGGAGDDALAIYYTAVEPDNARAVSLAKNAVKALPNDAAVLNTFGNALLDSGRCAEAAVRFGQATLLDPANLIFRNNLLGTLSRLRRAGDCAMAASEYSESTGIRIPLNLMPFGNSGRAVPIWHCTI